MYHLYLRRDYLASVRPDAVDVGERSLGAGRTKRTTVTYDDRVFGLNGLDRLPNGDLNLYLYEVPS